MQTNLYSTELRYTLSLLAFHVQGVHPQRVRIASQSTEMVKAFIRQMVCCPVLFYVDSLNIQVNLQETMGLKVLLSDDEETVADIAVFPFSIDDGSLPNGEAIIIVACENPLSYKSLIYPKLISTSIHSQLRCLRNDYRVTPIASLYSLRFIFWSALSKVVETLNPAWYFYLEDYSMRRLIEIKSTWRFSYLAVFIGQRTQ